MKGGQVQNKLNNIEGNNRTERAKSMDHNSEEIKIV